MRSLLSQPVPLRVAHGWWVSEWQTTHCSSVSSLSLPLIFLRLNTVTFLTEKKHISELHQPCIKCRKRGGEFLFSICLNISFYYLYINYHVKVLSWWLDIKHDKLFWEALFSKEDTQQQVRSKGSSLLSGFLPCWSQSSFWHLLLTNCLILDACSSAHLSNSHSTCGLLRKCLLPYDIIVMRSFENHQYLSYEWHGCFVPKEKVNFLYQLGCNECVQKQELMWMKDKCDLIRTGSYS